MFVSRQPHLRPGLLADEYSGYSSPEDDSSRFLGLSYAPPVRTEQQVRLLTCMAHMGAGRLRSWLPHKPLLSSASVGSLEAMPAVKNECRSV